MLFVYIKHTQVQDGITPNQNRTKTNGHAGWRLVQINNLGYRSTLCGQDDAYLVPLRECVAVSSRLSGGDKDFPSDF